MICLHRPFHLSETNIGTLGINITQGRFDEDALLKRAASYSAGLIKLLQSLLIVSLEDRLRACDSAKLLSELLDEICPQGCAPATIMIPMLDCTSQVEQESGSANAGTSTDSWSDADVLNSISRAGSGASALLAEHELQSAITNPHTSFPYTVAASFSDSVPTLLLSHVPDQHQ